MTERKKTLGDDEVVPYFNNDCEQIKFEFAYLIVLFVIGCILAFLFQFVFVTARGKNNQYNFPWESHKFYWRIFIPFLAALVAFCSYTILSPDTFVSSIKGHGKTKIAFSICFILGYFSDLVLSRLASWAEKLLPKKPGDNKRE